MCVCLRLQLWVSHEVFNQQKALSLQGPPRHKSATIDSPTTSQPASASAPGAAGEASAATDEPTMEDAAYAQVGSF